MKKETADDIRTLALIATRLGWDVLLHRTDEPDDEAEILGITIGEPDFIAGLNVILDNVMHLKSGVDDEGQEEAQREAGQESDNEEDPETKIH